MGCETMDSSSAWSPLQAGLDDMAASLDAKALLAELETACRFYKNIVLHLDFDDAAEDSTVVSSEDSTSETCSEASLGSDASIKYISLYKTEMCATFLKSGACPYHDKCKFAHGAHELRKIPRHPKYKSTPCRSFQQGNCSYGARCSFKHTLD